MRLHTPMNGCKLKENLLVSNLAMFLMDILQKKKLPIMRI